MNAGIPLERALQEACISAETWTLTQETWLSQMAKQALQKKYALHKRYSELLRTHHEATLQKLRKERRKLTGVMPVPPVAHMSPLVMSNVQKPAPQAFLSDPLPTPPNPIDPTPHLTIEQFAWLRTRLVLAPEQANEIRERVGLTEPMHTREDEIWQKLFAEDKNLSDTYEKVVAYYRRMLSPR
jgi:hypothetical protein